MEKAKLAATEILTSIEKQMFANDLSHLIPKFWYFTKELDKNRKQNIEELLPDLCVHIESHLRGYPGSLEEPIDPSFWYYTLKLNTLMGRPLWEAFPERAKEIKEYLQIENNPDARN